MKCYRCGEESPEPAPTRQELAEALQLATIELVQLRNEIHPVDEAQANEAEALSEAEAERSQRAEDIAELAATAKKANEEALESWSRTFAARPLIEALQQLLEDRVLPDTADGPLLRGCREWLTGKDTAEIAHVRTCPDCGATNTVGASTVAAAERITELEAERDQLRADNQSAALGRITELKDEARGYEAERDEAYEQCHQLRAELRRYEPSDAVMYRLHDYHEQSQGAATLLRCVLDALDGEQVVPEAWRKQADEWLTRHRTRFAKSPVYPLKDPDATVLALHTVIDEARRIMDRLWDFDQQQQANEDIAGIWKDLDAWRQKVLVHEGRERIVGEIAIMAKSISQLAQANARQAAELLALREAVVEAAAMLGKSAYVRTWWQMPGVKLAHEVKG